MLNYAFFYLYENPTTVTTITRHRTQAWLVEHHALRDGEGDLLAERWVVKDNPPTGFPCEVECLTMDEVLDTTAEFEVNHLDGPRESRPSEN